MTRGFPGGVGVTRLNVYPWRAPDGECGGSPHLHLASGEAYVVLAGRGRVQTIDSGGLSEYPLEQGAVLWFSPGTVHRIVRDDPDLDVLAIMDNAGLPENGDAVLTFPAEVLADPAAYRRAATLPAGASVAERERAVQERRDLALAGFAELREELHRNGPSALGRWHELAALLVRDRLTQWRVLVEAGPAAQVRDTLDQLDRLAAGDTSGLGAARVRTSEGTTAGAAPQLGMCGRLQTWDLRPDLDSAEFASGTGTEPERE